METVLFLKWMFNHIEILKQICNLITIVIELIESKTLTLLYVSKKYQTRTAMRLIMRTTLKITMRRTKISIGKTIMKGVYKFVQRQLFHVCNRIIIFYWKTYMDSSETINSIITRYFLYKLHENTCIKEKIFKQRNFVKQMKLVLWNFPKKDTFHFNKCVQKGPLYFVVMLNANVKIKLNKDVKVLKI